jgi:hypothetical protein
MQVKQEMIPVPSLCDNSHRWCVFAPYYSRQWRLKWALFVRGTSRLRLPYQFLLNALFLSWGFHCQVTSTGDAVHRMNGFWGQKRIANLFHYVIRCQKFNIIQITAVIPHMLQLSHVECNHSLICNPICLALITKTVNCANILPLVCLPQLCIGVLQMLLFKVIHDEGSPYVRE